MVRDDLPGRLCLRQQLIYFRVILENSNRLEKIGTIIRYWFIEVFTALDT